MGTTIEDISATKKRLNIEIPTDVIEKEFRRSLEDVKQRARIPGFRAGKAPDSMIEKKFGNDIKSDILDRLVPDYYTKAMKEASLVPVSMPKFESSLEIRKNEPLAIALTVEVRPEVGELNYVGMKVEDMPVVIEEKEVDDTLASLRESRVMYEPVDRDVKDDDLIIIDYVKFDPSGEKEIASAKDQVMNLGRNLTPQGILDAVLGKKKGDVIDIELPVVEGEKLKDDPGKGDKLKVTIKEVKEKRLPALDDELAKDFGYDDLPALREKVKENLEKNKKDHAARQQKAKLLDSLLVSREFDVPDSLMERELETLMLNEMQSQNQPGQEAASAGQDPVLLKEQLRPKAVRNVRAAMILDTIADREKITVSEDELKARVVTLARHMSATPEAIMNYYLTRDGSLDGLKGAIRDEKVLDFIHAKAEIVKGA